MVLVCVGKMWEDISNENLICSVLFVYEMEEVIKVRWLIILFFKFMGFDVGI